MSDRRCIVCGDRLPDDLTVTANCYYCFERDQTIDACEPCVQRDVNKVLDAAGHGLCKRLELRR